MELFCWILFSQFYNRKWFGNFNHLKLSLFKQQSRLLSSKIIYIDVFIYGMHGLCVCTRSTNIIKRKINVYLSALYITVDCFWRCVHVRVSVSFLQGKKSFALYSSKLNGSLEKVMRPPKTKPKSIILVWWTHLTTKH